MNAPKATRPCALICFPCKEHFLFFRRSPSAPLFRAVCLSGLVERFAQGGSFLHLFSLFFMVCVPFSSSVAAPSWSSLVALSVGAASSVRVRASVHSFSGAVSVFAFRSVVAASAFSARCAGVVGVFCAVRSVVGRGGVRLWCVSVPCLAGSPSAPCGWVRPAAALASLRRRAVAGGASC